MRKSVVIILADGFEEIEAVTPIDVLRRAGVDVVIAGLGKIEVKGSRGIKILADVTLETYQGLPDAVILPGGIPGADNLHQSKTVSDFEHPGRTSRGEWRTHRARVSHGTLGDRPTGSCRR